MPRFFVLSLVSLLALTPPLATSVPAVAQAIDIKVEVGSGDFERGGNEEYWNFADSDHGGMLWTWNVEEQDNFAKWRPDFPQGGDYEVLVFIPDHDATTRSARYEVHHRDGVADVAVNQFDYNNEWVSLGTFPFDAGKSTPGTREPGYLFLGDVTGETDGTQKVGIGAARFVLQGGVAVDVPEPIERQVVIVYLGGLSSNLGSASSDVDMEILRGFESADIGAPIEVYSYNGGEVDEGGAWRPFEYGCADTFHSLEDSVFYLNGMLRDYSERNPATDFVLVGHSLGGLVAWTAARQNLDLYGSNSRIAAVLTWGSILDHVLEVTADAETALLLRNCAEQERPSDTPIAASLAALPSEEDNNRDAERLISDGVGVATYLSTWDEAGLVLGDSRFLIEGSEGFHCNLGSHTSYKDSDENPNLYQHMAAYIGNVVLGRDKVLPSCELP